MIYTTRSVARSMWKKARKVSEVSEQIERKSIIKNHKTGEAKIGLIKQTKKRKILTWKQFRADNF